MEGREILIFHQQVDHTFTVVDKVFNYAIATMRKLEIANVEEESTLSDFRRRSNILLGLWQDNKLEGFTLVIDRKTGKVAWSICKRPDIFSRKVGRLLALNNLCDSLKVKHKVRCYKKGKLYLFNKTNQVVKLLDAVFGGEHEVIDIRYQLRQLGLR